MSIWQEYEERETRESCFVKDLDRFELAVQGVEYERCQSTPAYSIIMTKCDGVVSARN